MIEQNELAGSHRHKCLHEVLDTLGFMRCTITFGSIGRESEILTSVGSLSE
jgi:hypothetical protein